MTHPAMTQPTASARIRPLAAVILTLALLIGSLAAAAPARAITWGPKLCDTFAGCTAKGYGSAGYEAVYRQSFWNMYAGHNCTNYVAYRVQKAGVMRFVRAGYGNAYQWGPEAVRAGLTVDKGTPRVGDIAWWDRSAIGGSGLGHVAWVERVDAAAGTFTVSEDNYSADFDWRTYRISEVSGFIRLAKPAMTQSPIPTVSGSATVGGTLTAWAGTWAPGTKLGYEWLRDGWMIAGATGATYRPTLADGGHTLSARVTGALAGYTTTSRTSGALSVPVPPLGPSPTPVLSGKVRVGTTLTVNPGSWGPAPVSLAIQWLRDGAAISGATKATYTPVVADMGHAISARVTGTKAGYAVTARTSTAFTVPFYAFTAAPTPTLAGKVLVGRTLTMSPGTWTPAPATLALQWLRDGVPIAGATKASYVLTEADGGHRISARVTASKPTYATTARDSTSYAVPALPALTAAPVPTLAGKVQVSRTLTLTTGSWAPAPVGLTIAWLRDGVPIPGATKATYVVAEADAAHGISARVTGAKSGYATTVRVSTSYAVPPLLAMTASPEPTLAGKVQVSRTLTVTPGAWAPEPVTLAIQWLRDGAPIRGAVDTAYVVTEADSGHRISARVTGSKVLYATTVRESASYLVPPPLALTASPVPTLAGKVLVGRTLTVSPGTWEPAPVTLRIQWLRDGVGIAGATKATYLVAAADKAHAISARVTGSKLGYATTVRVSTAYVVAY